MQTLATLPDPWCDHPNRPNPLNRRVATAEEVNAGLCCEECLRCVTIRTRDEKNLPIGLKCQLAGVSVKRNWTCEAHNPERVRQ